MRKLSLPLRPLTPRTEGRSQTAERIDRLGLSLLVAAACGAFFYWLWRSAMPAVLAGGALSAILLPPLLRGERRVCLGRRRSASRARLAEAAVEALLLCEKTDAALKAASWLQKAYPLEALSPREGFCTGFLRQKRAAVFFLAQIRTATADDLLPLLRLARTENVQVCLICAACGFDEHAKTLANAVKPSVFLFDKKATASLVSEDDLPEDAPQTGGGGGTRRLRALRETALKRAYCPRYALAFFAMLAAFWQNRLAVYLLCAAASGLLFAFSLRAPRRTKLPPL